MKPTLIILAAGMGSRYGSLKQVDALGPNGETIIDYSVFDALRAGFGKIVFVIRKDIESDFLEVFGNKFDGKVPYEIVFQELDMLPNGITCPPDRVKPWGTAHAIWVCRNVVNEPFAVINADDFYGANSFRVLSSALSNPKLTEGEYFMVGYRLANTLSDEGSVSRGVCTVDKSSFLQDVIERTHIERINGDVQYKNENGNMVSVDEQSLVSMNCWGFTPNLFEHIDSMLNEFLGGSLANPKAEFYIPTVVNHLIKSGMATCKVLPTSSHWFGVTYPGDKETVMNKLQKLTANGVYPSPLIR
ncbi:MAG: nucleotidyltransferase [Bacteroidetes bacterium HGW-Bacteroidetes-15]|nr:MAG: nucleotidyltransferase [Bacteroidetes bacterium HGW-Bacteroidetes-15]